MEVAERMETPVNSLAGMRVAIIATNGFEQVELTEPRKALEEAEAITSMIMREVLRKK